MDELTIIVGLVGIASGGALFYAGRKVEQLNQRIKRLEEAQTTRLPYKAIDNLEDLQAVLLDLDRYIKATDARAQAASAIYDIIRNGKFDADRPAGRRPEPEP